MSASRFPAIAAELARRLRRGAYADRFPSTRALAEEFGTARQTVTNALRPLLAGGLLKARPPLGFFPGPAATADRHCLIGLVCRIENTDINSSPVFMAAEKFLAEQGCRLEVRGFPHGLPALHPEREFSKEYAGLIFMHSLLTLELAEYFMERGVPIVSCNKMPLMPHLNFVDVDVFAVWRDCAEYLTERGYRKVSWFFTSQLESYGAFARRSWRKIQQECGLEHFPGDLKIVGSPVVKSGKDLAEHLLTLHRSKIKPEVVICASGSPGETLRELEAQHPDLLPGVLFIVCQDEPVAGLRHRVFRTASFSDTVMQFQAAFEALEEKLLVPNRQPVRRLLRYRFQMFDEIPPKKERDRK